MQFRTFFYIEDSKTTYIYENETIPSFFYRYLHNLKLNQKLQILYENPIKYVHTWYSHKNGIIFLAENVESCHKKEKIMEIEVHIIYKKYLKTHTPTYLFCVFSLSHEIKV